MPDESQDPRKLRALAHPLRWKLIDLLMSEGSATATRCAEELGESVASCSYHLNFLAKYAYVEEAPGGVGREKPWRLASVRQDLSPDGPDPESELAARAAREVFLDHELNRIKERLRRRDEEPPEWREATELRGVTVSLTAEELREVSEALRAIAMRHMDRTTGHAAVPDGARETRIFIATSVAPRTRRPEGSRHEDNDD